MRARRSGTGGPLTEIPIYECPPLSSDVLQAQLAASGAWALLHDRDEEARGQPGWEVWVAGVRFTIAESRREAERWLAFKQLAATTDGFVWRSFADGEALPGAVPLWQVWVHGRCVGEVESRTAAERLLARRR